MSSCVEVAQDVWLLTIYVTYTKIVMMGQMKETALKIVSLSTS